MIDVEARNTFKCGDITPLLLKYVYGFNNYSLRDQNINKGLSDSDCPRYSNEESQEHVVQCEQTRRFRVDFLVELQTKLEQVWDRGNNEQEINDIIFDIRIFFM